MPPRRCAHSSEGECAAVGRPCPGAPPRRLSCGAPPRHLPSGAPPHHLPHGALPSSAAQLRGALPSAGSSGRVGGGGPAAQIQRPGSSGRGGEAMAARPPFRRIQREGSRQRDLISSCHLVVVGPTGSARFLGCRFFKKKPAPIISYMC